MTETETTCGCRPEDVPVGQVSKTIDQKLAGLDPQRAGAFVGLETARAARAAGYAREQIRLARKYGDDHPRVTALAGKIQSNAGLRRDVAFEAARAGTAAPVVDKTGYVFHGFVRDREGRGVRSLTIALYDENENWIRELGYGCTDAEGYFRMPPPRGRTDPTADPKSAARLAGGSGRGAARIYVLDSKKTTLQIEPEPLCPQLGNVDFRIIIIGGAETGSCTPPPPEAREPAPPPPATSTPLENIRGIGPAKARKLRAAGIKDAEALLKLDAAKLADLAGLDAEVVKREAAAAIKKNRKK